VPWCAVSDRQTGATVIIATLNRGEFLLDTLKDLVAQDYSPLEIMVVDQSMATETPGPAEKFARGYTDLIRYHRVNFRGLPQARNHAWQNAKYEALIFVDDDIRCGPCLVREHLQTLRFPGVGMVAGGVEERTLAPDLDADPGKFSFWTATPVRSFAARRECPAMHVAGCNFSIWRSVLQQAGGVDEALAQGAALYEETELCLRVTDCGFHIRFNGSARVLHLLAGQGGCRTPDMSSYVASLAHNRTILIDRYLTWFQMPSAYIRLLLLITSYAAHHRNPGLLSTGFQGIVTGRQAAQRPRLCANYQIGERV
jgi:GT2 family glycosyltransferase